MPSEVVTRRAQNQSARSPCRTKLNLGYTTSYARGPTNNFIYLSARSPCRTRLNLGRTTSYARGPTNIFIFVTYWLLPEKGKKEKSLGSHLQIFAKEVKFGNDGKLVRLCTIAKRNQSTYKLELDAHTCLQKYSLDCCVKVQDHLVERNCKGFGHTGSFTRALKTTLNRQTIDYFWTSQSSTSIWLCFCKQTKKFLKRIRMA